MTVKENISELKLCTVETFKGMFYYLDIPKYKVDLIKKMISFRKLGVKANVNYRDKRKSKLHFSMFM